MKRWRDQEIKRSKEEKTRFCCISLLRSLLSVFLRLRSFQSGADTMLKKKRLAQSGKAKFASSASQTFEVCQKNVKTTRPQDHKTSTFFLQSLTFVNAAVARDRTLQLHTDPGEAQQGEPDRRKCAPSPLTATAAAKKKKKKSQLTQDKMPLFTRGLRPMPSPRLQRR